MCATLLFSQPCRGGCKLFPENTLLAFKNAVNWTDESGQQKSTQMVELDIQKTRDGELVVIHNLTVDETTEGTGLVADLTLREIRYDV